MANTVPLSASDTNTQMDNGTLNPDVDADPLTGVNRNAQIVHITLVCQNVTVTPDDVYDALDTEFAVVAGEKTTMSRGTWIFNIGPA